MTTSQKKTFLTVFIVLNLIFAVHCQEACGDQCSCIQTSATYSYDCRARGLTVTPVGVSPNATTLNLSNNQINMLLQGSFNNLRQLEFLYLQANAISYIQPGTFNGMMNLKQLILSSNSITEIERDTFAHLPALEVLDLSQNKITTINRYALFTVPSLYLVNFAQNPINCGCEEMMLQQFFDQRGSNLIVDKAVCANFGVELKFVANGNYNACPTNYYYDTYVDGIWDHGVSTETLFQADMRCYSCSGVKGVRACMSNQVQQCSGTTPVCYTRMDYYYPGSLTVSGGCMDYQTCLNQEVRNIDTCMQRGLSAGTTCTFCDPDRLGNYRDVVNTTKEFDVQLLITLALDMTPQLQDTSSPEYDSFTKNLRNEVENYVQGQIGSYRVTFIDLRAPRVTMSFVVHCATMWFNSQSEVILALTKALATRRFNGFTVQEINMYTIGKAKCQAETIADVKYGTITWPPTDPGTIAFVECPHQLESATVNRYASRNCKRENDNSGTWLAPDLSDCPQVDSGVRDLENLANTDVTENNVEEISSSLKDLSSGWSEFETTQVDWTVRVIDGILTTDKSGTSKDVIDNTLDSVNNVLYIDQSLLSEAENEYQTSNRLVAAVDRLLTNVDVTNGDVKLQRDNIAGLVTGVTGTGFNGLSMSYQHDGVNTLTDTQISLSQSEAELDDGKSGIVLPQTLFQSLSASQKSSVGKVSLSVYRNAKLFSSITQTNETREIERDGDTLKVETKINSNVIAATVPDRNIRNLQSPVIVTLRHVDAGENASCVFWDTNAEVWSTSGCVVNYTSETVTICHCDHLTNFALLMDVYGSGGDMSDANKLALSIISYIGCGLSLFGVACTLFTYIKFRKLRRDNPSKILMNLCVAIGMVDIVFLVGVQPYASSSSAGCKVIAILLHYFLLSALCWMMVEAFYMYLALVKIFDTYIAHFQLKSALFGWGIPAVIVAVTLGINKTENYGIQPGGLCWLSQIPFYGAFLAPVCIMLIVNTIIYILVMRQIITRGSNKLSKTDTSNTAVRLRGAIGLLILLGLTWVFAILAVDDFGIVFHYLFAIFNSAQGFFIFIFYCCLKKEAQQCWKKSLPCFKSPYEQTTSSNTQSKDTTSTLDTNKTMKSNVQSKDDAGESSVPPGQPANTAFRGRWQVQVADPKPQTCA